MHLVELADLYIPHIDKLLSDSEGVTYAAVYVTADPKALDSFKKSELAGAMTAFQRAYVLSILERCHLASLTSLARLHGWLTGALEMAAAKNALGFAACLRGYVEAGADAHDALNAVPSSLIEAGTYLFSVMNRPDLVSSTAVGFDELEKKLIHYEFAARRPKIGPILPHHVAAETTAYIRNFEKDQGIAGLEALYAHLCDLTHPARGSVSAFLAKDSSSTSFTRGGGSDVINSTLTDYSDTLQELVSRSMNVGIVSIAMLSMLTGVWPSASPQWIGSNPSLANLILRLKVKIDIASHAGATEDDIRASLS